MQNDETMRSALTLSDKVFRNLDLGIDEKEVLV